MGDPDLGADLLVEAERSFQADGYVLSAFRGWDGEYLNVTATTFDIENGQCFIRNGTPTKGIACETVGYDRGPILRAEGYVTARNAAGIAVGYEVARGDSWERVAERFCSAPKVDVAHMAGGGHESMRDERCTQAPEVGDAL